MNTGQINQPAARKPGNLPILPAKHPVVSKPTPLGKIQPAARLVRLPAAQPPQPKNAGQRPLVQSPAQPLSQYIGKYRIVKQIGEGGMGAVFLAMHPQMRKPVVIKKLLIDKNSSPLSSKMIKGRFFREADDLMKLSNPHIVKLYDYFSENGADYIVLEYIDGMALDKLLAKQGEKLPVPVAMQIFLDTCHGLKAAHANGIIHRDIKPGNILLSRRAEVKLADFGIAGKAGDKNMFTVAAASAQDITATASPDQNFETKAGSVLGTPAYMSPEQISDSSSADKRSDIYSMGVMLYVMLTGTRPFGTRYTVHMMEAIKKGDCPPAKKLNRHIPQSINRMIRKMMAVQKEDRYASIDEVMKKCEAYLAGFSRKTRHDIRRSIAASVRSSTMTEYPAWKPVRRWISRGLALCLVPLLLLACHEKGILRATILRPLYTPVEFSVRIPGGNPHPDAKIEAYSGPQWKKLGGPAAPRKLSRILRTERGMETVSSGRMYLRPGHYRVRLTVGQYALWKDIEAAGYKPVQVTFTGLPAGKRPLNIRINASDAETGKSLDNQASVLFLTGNGWETLENAVPEAGSTVTIRIICPGYRDGLWEIETGWNETDLMIDANLVSDKIKED